MRWSKDLHLPAACLFSSSFSSSSSSSTSWSFFRPVQCLVLLMVCLLPRALCVGASVSARGGTAADTQEICGTTFTDAASSALLAQVVLEGRVRQKIYPGGGSEGSGRYNVSIQVRKQVWKGRELINNGKKARKLLLGVFASAPQDTVVVSDDNNNNDKVVVDEVLGVTAGDVGGEVNCVADVAAGSTYIFFLRDVGDKKGRYFELSALPVKKNRRVSRIVSKILKKNGAKMPKIQRLKGPRTVKRGSSLTLRCKASAKPNPVFTWYRDGVALVSRRGQRIKHSKRSSRLKISKTDKDSGGVYTCEASNALGTSSKNVTVKVTAPELIHVACQKQTYCFNGGTCRYIPDLHQTFCQCPEEWAGRRCEILDPFGQNGKLREARLVYERTLIVVGIVIALLVFVVICIASYFLANRRRRRWEARRRMRKSLGPESDRLLDKTDGGQMSMFVPGYRPSAQKETQTDNAFHPPAFPPKPDLESEPALIHTYRNNPGNIFLRDSSFPLITSTAAATCATPPSSNNHMQRATRPVSDIESRELDRGGSRSRLKAVSMDECIMATVNAVVDSQSMPAVADGEVGSLEVPETNAPHASNMSNPEPSHGDNVDGVPDSLPVSSPQLVAAPVDTETPSRSSAEALSKPPEVGTYGLDPAVLPPENDCLKPLVLMEAPRSLDPSEAARGETLPINGIPENWDSDGEEPDTPLPALHISEEDLNGNVPKLDSFDSDALPSPPSPEQFAADPASPSLSPLSPVDCFGSYRPKDLPTVVLDGVHVPFLGARPGSVSEDDSAGFLPHTISSTEASSPLTEGTPQGETYAFDPCIDSDPNELDEQFMHGSPKKKSTSSYSGTEDKQDYERRLRNVCADQDAIPI